MQVSASDNVAVSAVTFSVDGIVSGTASFIPYAFSWDCSTAGNGAHTLTATAVDIAGNTSSVAIAVSVNNAVADVVSPMVTVTSPGSGARVSGNVTVTCVATDNVGVVKVALYVDGVLTATSTTAPFTTKWNTNRAVSGAHSIQARVYDAAGNSGVSTAFTVYK